MSRSVFLFDNQVFDATISASSAVLPVANLHNPQRSKFWRSGLGMSSFLDLTLSSVLGIDFIALIDLNLTTAGTINVKTFSDPAFTLQTGEYMFSPTVYVNPDAVASPYGSGPYGVGAYGSNTIQQQDGVKNITIYKFPAQITDPYFRVQFVDPVGDYQQLGLLYLGQGFEFDSALSYGWRRRLVPRSPSREAIGGQRYTQRRDPRVQISGTFELFPDNIRSKLIIRLDEFVDDKPFIFSIYPDADNRGLTTTLYGRFESAEVSGRTFNRNDFPFSVLEEL